MRDSLRGRARDLNQLVSSALSLSLMQFHLHPMLATQSIDSVSSLHFLHLVFLFVLCIINSVITLVLKYSVVLYKESHALIEHYM